jgi:hypothetical protein
VAETTVKNFYAAGFDALVNYGTSVSMLVEDMSRNKCFFKVLLSHVLRFISICDLFADSPSYNIPTNYNTEPNILITKYQINTI